MNRLLSAPGSEKEVRHYELDLTGAGIAYSAGDSIAVHVANDPDLVDAVLAELDAGPDHAVAGYDEPLGVLLTHHLDIRAPSRALRALVASAPGMPTRSPPSPVTEPRSPARGCTAGTCST